MKPQNQRKRERAREKEWASEWASESICLVFMRCLKLFTMTCTWAQTQTTGTLVYTHYLSVTGLHLLTNSSQATFACVVSNSTAHFWMQRHSQLPGTLYFPCFATHPNFTKTERKRERGVSEREHVCGVRLTLWTHILWLVVLPSYSLPNNWDLHFHAED